MKSHEGHLKEKRSLHRAWIILIICAATLFVSYSLRYSFSLVLPEMIGELRFTRIQGGSVFNASLFMYVIGAPLMGMLTDRFGARPVITCCVFILGSGALLMGTVHSLGMACLAYGIVGLGAAGIWTPIVTLIQRWFAPTRKGLALGVLSVSYGLGFATMGVIFPWIINHLNWRYNWYFLGAGALLMVLINGLFLRSDPESSGHSPWGLMEESSLQGNREAPSLRMDILWGILKNRTFWLIGLSYLSISCGLYGITVFMVDYAKVHLGLPLERASLLATVHGTCQIPGVLLVLPLSDYLGRRNTILISNALITISLAGILWSGESWVMLFIFVGMMAMFFGVTFPIYGACAGDYFHKEYMGTVMGAWTTLYGLGAMTATWVCGGLRDWTGRYDEAFVFIIVMSIVGLLLILPIRNRRHLL